METVKESLHDYSNSFAKEYEIHPKADGRGYDITFGGDWSDEVTDPFLLKAKRIVQRRLVAVVLWELETADKDLHFTWTEHGDSNSGHWYTVAVELV